MRMLSIVVAAFVLTLAGACGSQPQQAATVQTPSAPVEEHGVPAGGPAGEITVPMGETVALSTSVLGGEVDRVEITVAGGAPAGGTVTVAVTIRVTAGVYLASPANFVLVADHGAQYLPQANTFANNLTGVNAGERITGTITYQVGDPDALEDATIAVYGLAEGAATYAAHWSL